MEKNMTILKLNRKEWHETFLRMVGSTSLITLIISMSSLIIYYFLSHLSQSFFIQNILISFSFISLFILTAQTLRSMYHLYHLPLMNNCPQSYQKIIFFCSSFSMGLIIVSSLIMSISKTLQEYIY